MSVLMNYIFPFYPNLLGKMYSKDLLIMYGYMLFSIPKIGDTSPSPFIF